MGKILNGILGGFSGKVGPVVGGKWKDVNYMRSYVIPANPNTPDQQVQRGKFAQCVSIARSILTDVIKPFWDPFLSSMSGFNRFLQLNVMSLSTPNDWLDATLKVAQGTLTPQPLTSILYSDSDGEINVTWTNNAGTGNALGTDKMAVVVFHRDGTLVFTSIGNETRENNSIRGYGLSGLDGDQLFGFLFAYRGTGSELTVSNSVGIACERV